MQYWLMKSEPNDYSIHDLERDGCAPWDGVRNYQVRNMLRDTMKIGDKAIFYHSNAGADTGAAGEMMVVSSAKADDTQFVATDHHYDPQSSKTAPRWWCREMRYVSTFPRIVTLREIKSRLEFCASQLTNKGNRLSIVPLTKEQYDAIYKMAHS
jgi:predicted RNA-binding protein with PUA-like domain